MKSVSAAVIVLSGAVMFVGGAFRSTYDIGTLLIAFGSILGVIGMLVWLATVSEELQRIVLFFSGGRSSED